VTTLPPRWTTSSYGETTETTPMELADLGEHKAQCSAAHARLVAMQCSALRLHGVVTGRLVTTLAVVAALIAALLYLAL
jgi:hypothetical protein